MFSKKQSGTREETQLSHKDSDNHGEAVHMDGFPIVAIGASAGGLEALETFFFNLPEDTGIAMSFIVVQHMPPDYKSILSELLKQYTNLQVHEAEDGMAVAPNSVYVIPANTELTIRGGRLYLSEPGRPRGLCLFVDILFRSLAQEQKERSVCIVLSGAGTDGTLGLKAVKDEGGMAMAQDPDTAAYKSMPRNAIESGLVDYVLSPDEMPEYLIAYIQHSFGKGKKLARLLSRNDTDSLQQILTLIHAHTGHDFSGYKQSTIVRRIERRLAVNLIENQDDYLSYLEQNPMEVEALFRELLVGVTRFFRDPEAYAALTEKVLPRLFENKRPGDSIRIWVPACSTGEEAYSLAILLQEYLQGMKKHYKVQIFATDIDSGAIEYARTGLYPEGIAADVSPERLKRFFTWDPGSNTYQVGKTIRSMLVFAEQNATGDPPFSRLDMISCRNLLIYMDNELQKKVLHLFHYALNHSGFLFLGTSETISEFGDFFETVDRKWRLYQSKGIMALHSVPKNFLSPLIKKCSQNKAILKDGKSSFRELVENALLQQFSPPSVVTDTNGDILYIHGRTGKYLEPAQGEGSLNILKMAREGLKLELNAAIRKVVVQKEPIHIPGLQVMGNGENTRVNVTVSPVFEGISALSSLIMVVFQEVVLPEICDKWKEVAATGETVADERVFALERELRNKEEYLQTVIEELETSNEELQSTNEEFQSVNEELETSKEELQSLNEELMIVNAELQKKIDELSCSNNDMNNMLAGTGVGTVFVDHELRIKRFTPVATQLINLIHADLGRPITHIVSNIMNYHNLGEDVQEVLDTLRPKEVQVRTKSEKWYLMRILPYRTSQNAIEGAVINFIDFTEQKMFQRMNRLAVVVRDSNDAVTMQDFEGRILAWNPGAEKIYGWSEQEALSMNIRDTIPESERENALKIIKQLAENKRLEPFQARRITRDGHVVEVCMTATVLLNEKGERYAVATTERLAGE
ncbi:chemotaxis protein CheB [Dethiobacter alkaliphilus]|uniref:protein-glutamate O-methyltransferase n=1 Tax=Dethiobacter alkaliphilus AHT 1 TaxID=555088 RepID=C0GJU0_DETAL|nr:chemotaxis protein CheB [Dethiobacter alkaliphilus]EEG76398.1 MCP methyltransferase/methylesterase, CheR/CheB with PAS/PAC sensor [Dethiobacter alkaliphilus AHT 1]